MGNETRIAGIRRLAGEIGRPVALMEVCGTHTMAAFRTGLRSLLPENVRLISGPGCPVCVTPDSYIDKAVAIALHGGATVATFGDMMRVPGNDMSLEQARAMGADVRVVYSPLDALKMALEKDGRRVVFLGVGFETTTPAVAWTILEAARLGADGFSALCGHKTVPEAMMALLAGGECRIDGFICPGHVSVIIGAAAYDPVCRVYGIPCVVAGFEAADMAAGIERLLAQIVENRAGTEIEYSRSVGRNGNGKAKAVVSKVFSKADSEWRGIGVIPGSGLAIREEYSRHDADRVFSGLAPFSAAAAAGSEDKKKCACGSVLRGVIQPPQCGLFGKLCTPENPVGPCMVSSEGSCAAHYKYARRMAGSG